MATAWKRRGTTLRITQYYNITTRRVRRRLGYLISGRGVEVRNLQPPQGKVPRQA